MAVKIQVEVFWVVTPCRIPAFWRTMLPPSLGKHDPPKHWYPTATLYGITAQKILTCKSWVTAFR